jgi:hypothetical protein
MNVVDWINNNSGVIEILLFILSLFIAWFAGFFKYLKRNPKFKIKLLDGPTQCSEVETGEKKDGFEIKRACFSFYLKIANIGFSSSSIKSIKIKYKSDTFLFENFWLWKKSNFDENKISNIKFLYKWTSKISLTSSLSNFEYKLNDDKTKQYAHLIQHNEIIENPDKFLERGKSTGGIIYFESERYFGGYQPKVIGGFCDVKIYIKDVFSNRHVFKVKVPYKTIEEARKYNSEFGNSYKSIENE